MKLKEFLLLISVVSVPANATDYSQGVFFVNEDWYGHQNSTVNHLDPDGADPWTYRVFQAENPGMELGCTAQHGAIHDGRFYIIAKQEKDPGASVTGGRITVADAATMECISQLELIDPSGAQCDGRAFLGIDAQKGYVSTSNGVWVLDLDLIEITSMIDGTGNDEGSLYYGQCGSMVMASGLVFVAHQSRGILVIDPVTDTVVETITFEEISDTAAVGSVVKSKDGHVWASVAKNTSGSGATEPYLVEIDPEGAASQISIHALPDDIDAPANSWYAWTPDGFCASAVRNALYWNGGASSWFSQQRIYRYDIDAGTYERIIDLDAEGDGWSLYGCSLRPHPVTDELFMSLFVAFANTTYVTRRADYLGQTLQEYPMIANYWFPSLPVFPEQAAADDETSLMAPVTIPCTLSSAPSCYDLQGRPVADPTRPGVYIKVVGGRSTKHFVR